MAGDLVNPYPNSHFQQAMVSKKESIYGSHQRAPLGISHDQSSGLHQSINPVQFTFGIQTEKGEFIWKG